MRRTDYMLGGRDFATLVAAQVMESNISRVGEDAGWRAIAHAMTDRDIQSIPVVDETNGLIGIITEYDILRPVAEGKNVDDIKAKDILSKDVVTVTSDTSAIAVIKMFEEKRIFKIFVVDEGALQGVIVKHDLVLGYLHATRKGPEGFDTSIF